MAAFAAPFQVEDPSALFPLPGREAVLRLIPGDDGPAPTYRICGFDGQEISRGQAFGGNAGFEIAYSLPVGYYEVQLADCGQTFGVAVYPESPAPSDGFWCIDAGLTWCGWSDQWKRAIVKLLLQRGIGGFRERMSWHIAEEGDSLAESDTVRIRRRLYPTGRVLELLHDSPAKWRRGNRRNSFDFDLARGAAGLASLEALSGSAYSAVELWNEPFYNDSLPADQYVPVAKMMGATLQSMVAGGSFTTAVSPDYLRLCCESGFLEILDAFSLHSYGPPEIMGQTVEYFRKTLSKYGHGDMPLWITESGTPGSVDPATGRSPSAAADAKSATATAMRAIVSKALGVERFYAFYLQQHVEGKIAWGLTDAAGTAQRGIAAYLAAAWIVGGRRYCGDAKPDGDYLLAPAFTDGKSTVLAIHGPQGARLRLPSGAEAIHGADGRRLKNDGGGDVVNVDGLLYAVYPAGVPESWISPPPAASSGDEKNGRRIRHRLIIQPCHPGSQVLSHGNNGYVIAPEAAGKFRASAWICNLEATSQDLMVTLSVPDGERLQRRVTVPANGNAKVDFDIDFRGALEQRDCATLRWDADADGHHDHVVQYFTRPPQVRSLLVRYAAAPPLCDGFADSPWNGCQYIIDTTVQGEIPGALTPDRQEFSSEAKFLWSDLGLHFLVKVHDREHEAASSDADCWQYDSLQLAVSQYNSENDHNRFEWGFYLGADGQTHHAAFITSSGHDLTDDSTIAIRRDEAAGITWYEGLVAWSDLGSMNAIYNRNGMRMRFTFCVNDHNRGSRRWSQWSPGIAAGKNTGDFPEIILTAEAPVVRAIDLESGRFAGRADAFTVLDGIATMEDVKNCRLVFEVDEVALDRPVTLGFELASTQWREHGGTGFSFIAGFASSVSGERRECWIAPSAMYGGVAGYAVNEANSPAPSLGAKGVSFPPDGEFHAMEFTLDPSSGKMTLCEPRPDGTRAKLAEGSGVRARMHSFDRICFSSSGWGAGPFLLRNIRLKY